MPPCCGRHRDPHRLACACLCIAALLAWVLALAGLASLVAVACSPAGRRDSLLPLGGGEGDFGGGLNAFVACGREYKLRWWTLFMHAGVWSGCAWAVASRGGGQGQQQQQGDNRDGGGKAASGSGSGSGSSGISGDGLLRGSPPSTRLWPPPPPPPSSHLQPSHGALSLANSTATTALLPRPPPRSLFAARACALSPPVCAAFALAVLCADADLDSGATTAPGVMEWWYELARGSRPFGSVQAQKYAAVQAAATGWVLLAFCDAAWAWAQVAFARGEGFVGGVTEVGGGRWGRRQQQQQQQRRHWPVVTAVASPSPLDRLELPSSSGGGGGGSAGSSSGLGAGDACVRLEISGAGGVAGGMRK